jgi:PAS domain-containing protein
MLAVYPIQIFDEKFSVIFSLTRASELEGIFNLFLLVILANVFLIVLVSFLFIRNLKKLNALSDELKSNQIKLIELVDQQKLLFEYSEDFTYRHDREGNYDYVSENVLKVLGYTPE